MIEYLKTNYKSILFYVGVVLFAYFISHFILMFAKIPSESMENTLKVHDRLIANRLAYVSSEPERGDIIIFKPPIDDDYYIKRIIGLPGDKVTIGNGVVYINDEPLNETYVKESWKEESYDDEGYYPDTYVVPKDSYFVMGDNRLNSLDSRYWAQEAIDSGLAKSKEDALQYSFVKKDSIYAKAFFKYFSGFKVLD